MTPRIQIKGPSDFLRVVMYDIAAERTPENPHWKGVFDGQGGGAPRHPNLDVIRLSVRDGVSQGDATDACRRGLDQIAEAHGMSDARSAVTVSYLG